MADTVIENLITKLSFDFDEKKLEKFDEFVDSAAKGLTAIVAGATAAATAIGIFTQKIAESNDELSKLARRTGIDIETLQELGLVAELNGGSIDSMNSSLENLSRIASEASRGLGAGVEVFGILGISVTEANGRIKAADVLLNDISDSISKLSTQAERLEFAQKLGIGGDLLLAIQEGSEAIERQRKEARELGFVIDKDAGEAAELFIDSLTKIEKIILGISNAIGTRLIKQFNPMLKMMVEWFKINKSIIQQNLSFFLDKAISTIKGVFNIVFRVVGIVNSLVKAMGGWKNSIIAVTGLLVAMNASALLMPILVIAAGAAILLILEDIIKFAEGGESAVGELAKKYKLFDILLRGFLKTLKLIRDGWILIFTQGDEALKGLIQMVKDLGSAIVDFILAPFEKVSKIIKKIFKKDIGANISVNNKAANQSRVFKIDPQTGNVVNNTTNSPNVSITINGGDTEKVKQTVENVLNEQYRGAQTNLESEVLF